MDDLFNRFSREKQYLQNVSKNTLKWYSTSYLAYKKVCGTEFSKEKFTDFIIALRERGLNSGGINNYIRGLNIFLGWLYENKHTTEHLKIKKVKEEKVIIKTFSDAQLGAIISYKPKKWVDRRLHTLLLLLIDTGVRIDEALTLRKSDINIDSLVFTVLGKGRKERVIPFSLELRKVLYKFMNSHDHELVFCTKQGQPFMYRNVLRDFKILGKRLGITGVRVSPHTLRHTFAYNYIKHGGNVMYLQRILGHTDITMTRRYVDLQTEDLAVMHTKISTLKRLR